VEVEVLDEVVVEAVVVVDEWVVVVAVLWCFVVWVVVVEVFVGMTDRVVAELTGMVELEVTTGTIPVVMGDVAVRVVMLGEAITSELEVGSATPTPSSALLVVLDGGVQAVALLLIFLTIPLFPLPFPLFPSP
jgi:hypothetical protein